MGGKTRMVIMVIMALGVGSCSSSIPVAESYDTSSALAAAVDSRIPCEPRRLESPHENLDFAICRNEPGTIHLWVFSDRVSRDSWAASITAEVDALLGPNWIVSVTGYDLEDVQRAVGGKLRQAVRSQK